MNTLQKVFEYAKVGVAIFFQIYGISSYLPQMPLSPIAAIYQEKGNRDEKSMVYDTASGFLRVKYETIYLACLKQEELVGNDKPDEQVATPIHFNSDNLL